MSALPVEIQASPKSGEPDPGSLKPDLPRRSSRSYFKNWGGLRSGNHRFGESMRPFPRQRPLENLGRIAPNVSSGLREREETV